MNLRILLVESDPEDALFLRDVLQEMESSEHWSSWLHIDALDAPSWPFAKTRLAAQPADAILLSMNLDDSQAVEMFRDAQATVPNVPVILLIEPAGIESAVRLIREGAQDYLIKKDIDCGPLAHALRNAIERQRLMTASRASEMTDALTGLLNRTAFQRFAGRDCRIAEKCACRIAILLAGPGNLSTLAGAPGDQQRDLRLVEAAERLRACAGLTDLVARVGHTRFAISMPETLAESLDARIAGVRDALSVQGWATGLAIFNPACPVSLDTLLEGAEQDLALLESVARRGAAAS
jgi:PleD family two-component response regulator